uniref:Uncharacterized protein n=1 Tax=Cacopsylla melanoneura TaxID=428564 RepID=A0A8D9AQL7_9HEMI
MELHSPSYTLDHQPTRHAYGTTPRPERTYPTLVPKQSCTNQNCRRPTGSVFVPHRGQTFNTLSRPTFYYLLTGWSPPDSSYASRDRPPDHPTHSHFRKYPKLLVPQRTLSYSRPG